MGAPKRSNRNADRLLGISILYRIGFLDSLGDCLCRGRLKQENDRETLGTWIVQVAINFTVGHDLTNILTVEAFFSSAVLLKMTESLWTEYYQRALVQVNKK